MADETLCLNCAGAGPSWLCLGDRASATRRRVGPVAWSVLEVVAFAAASCGPRGDLVAELSVRSIAVELGLSKDTVAAALTRLIADGSIRRDVVRRSSRFAGSRYTIVGDVGVLPCRHLPGPASAGPASSCTGCSDTNVSDSSRPCEPQADQLTLKGDDSPTQIEPLRLFE